jgi:lipopolysaccharide transport system ATP-binding protein
MIKDRLGQPIYGTNTHHLKRKLKQLPSQQALEYNFEFNANLGPGSYSIAIALHADDTHIGQNYEWCDQAIVFSVVNINQPDFVGVAWLPPEVRCTP